ncbi:MAG TPA: glycerol-3-phosphate 1-O-acyltransferase PlsY [Planctomycetota bacterium]|nr:glycerol-3-phosphate 1-O-acyltransferase PlsY [Planctomycetota bacterium]
MLAVLGYSLAVLLSYLLGSIPFGYLMGRLGGIDIRRWGSKNVGATNVGRVLGFRRGVFVFVLDVLKGAGAVGLIGRSLAGWFELDPSLACVLCGASAVLGHTFPCWLRFKGGKGVATALGVWLVLAPVTTLIALAVWAGLVAVWRYVSLGSIVGAVVLPCAFLALHHDHLGEELPQLVFAVLVAVLVILRHVGNIGRLLKGTESKVKPVFYKAIRSKRPGDSSDG